MRAVCPALLFAVLLTPACDRTETRPPASAPPIADTRPVTNALIDLANKDLARGRWVSAKRRAEEALARDPSNADAHAVLGAAHWRGGDWSASTSALETALVHDPTNFGAAVALGRNLQAAGDHARAISLQDKLLVADPEQRDPLLCKLWSQYALLDVDGALATLDRLFRLITSDDPLRPLLLARAGFLRPLAGKGPLLTLSGTKGSSDLQIDPAQGFRHSLGALGSEVTRVILFEMREETKIHRPLADRLKLTELGRFTPLGAQSEVSVVLIPELAFGDLKLLNVPAIVDDLTPFTVGEVPGVVLGRQALHRIGAVTYDLQRAALDLQAAPPTTPPPGSFAAPLLLLDTRQLLAPVTTIAIGGSPHTFHAILGGAYASSLTVDRRQFLKSGHLPRELERLDDPEAGMLMVYIDGVKIGDAVLSGGLGGIVLTNTPPDPVLGHVREGSAFELGGYLNTPLFARMTVTYALSSGKLHITPRP